MFEKLLGKSKRKRRSDDPFSDIEVDDSIDLESGTIYIDDTIDPARVVATSDVFEQKDEEKQKQEAAAPVERKPTIAGGGARIFLLDLNPFFKAIGTKKGERSADTFTRFAENWLKRSIEPAGICELVGGDVFFFRLSVPNREAAVKAVQIVNDIGTQYLRDAYKAEDLLPEILGAVDGKLTKDGRFDAANQRDILAGWRTIAGRKKAAATVADWGETKEREDPTSYMVPIERGRKASERVQRGPARRKKNVAINGQDRRRLKYGRRATDKPGGGTSVWK